MKRRELLKLGAAALIAPLVKHIPDSEIEGVSLTKLTEHPLLLPIHKDTDNAWVPDTYGIMAWSACEVYWSCDEGDTWTRIASLDPYMSELQRNLFLRGLVQKIAAEHSQAV